MASLFGSNASKAAQHAAERAQQNQISLGNQGDLFQQQYQNALPGLSEAQTYFLQRAGLIQMGPNGQPQIIGTGTPVSAVALGTAPGVNGGKPYAAWGSRGTAPGFQVTQPAGTQVGPSFQDRMNQAALGIYNSPEYQMLRQAAQEDINRQMVDTGRNYANELTGRGLQNSSLQAGGQAGITAAANKDYSDFTRQLALNAANKQDTLVGQALQSLSPSLNAGQQATGAYGEAGNLSNSGIGINQQVKNQQGSTISNALAGLGQLAGPALAAYMGAPGMGAGGGSADGGTGDLAATGVNMDPNPTAAEMASLGGMAHGGKIFAGHTVLTGEQGPETFVPQHQIGGLLRVFAGLIDKHMDHNKPRMPARQQGGPVTANRPFLVGEGGPEVFTPRQNGVIIPNPATPTAGFHPNINRVLQFALSQGNN